jgi:tetrahydromethanopterin S-methyltransferase subunit G
MNKNEKTAIFFYGIVVGMLLVKVLMIIFPLPQ